MTKKVEIAGKYREGGYGYGHAKKELLAMITDYFAEARERRKELEMIWSYVYDVLQEGGKKARERAEMVMEPIREATGLFRSFKYWSSKYPVRCSLLDTSILMI
jgi:tryptophanyl-tRNA synthetase